MRVAEIDVPRPTSDWSSIDVMGSLEVMEMSEIVARVPERHKKIGVRYAVSDDGLELPVIDITHPAFAIAVSPAKLADIADRTVRSLERSSRMPGLVQRVLRRRSILVRQTIESSGGYLSGMSNRLRLQETARLIADGLAPLLTGARADAAVHLLNIGGGPAMDSINALILLNKEHRARLVGRRVGIHVFDIDGAGPRFGARALAALGAAGAPLDGLDVAFDHVAYDWREPATLRDALGRLGLAGDVVGISSEGGLFEYGIDQEIVANLEVLGDGTPHAAALTASLILDDRVGRVMKEMSRMQLQLRTLDGLAALVGRAGWTVARTAGRGFVHDVVSLKQV